MGKCTGKIQPFHLIIVFTVRKLIILKLRISMLCSYSDFGYTDVKRSCEEGICGSCTVLRKKVTDSSFVSISACSQRKR